MTDLNKWSPISSNNSENILTNVFEQSRDYIKDPYLHSGAKSSIIETFYCNGDEYMSGKSHDKSRRKTPWDKETELTPTQEFLRTHYKEHYEARHLGRDIGEFSFSKSQTSSL